MKKILLLIAIMGFVKVNAQDRVFNYTYQSGVLNKGQKEIEIWSTLASGRDNFYRSIKHRMEYEVGLGGKLQTSFYLNYRYSKSIVEENGIQSLKNDVDYSFSNEWKLKLSDPVANRIGSALYFEYTLAPGETEIEGKIILDKQIGNFTHAFNLVGEYEFEKEFKPDGTRIKTENERELKVELNYGLSYRIKNNLSVGVEAMNQNQIAESKWENSVLTLGPCISYSTNGFWVNLTVMPQIANLKGGGLELNEHERLQTRLIFSYVF
ncbi:MAG: hypothetical protein GZ094_04725 [Mariniphaga sp.]|nr:hypothetical protein [Mariniphaga sp.]